MSPNKLVSSSSREFELKLCNFEPSYLQPRQPAGSPAARQLQAAAAEAAARLEAPAPAAERPAAGAAWRAAASRRARAPAEPKD